KTSFFHPDFKKKITDANFYGVFSNGDQKNAATSFLKLENIRFDFNDKMIQGNFLYRNFNNPYIAFDVTGMVNAAALLDFYKIPGIRSASGNIDFDIDFKGLLDDFKTREGHERIETGGEITIKDLAYTPEDANFKLEKTNGTFIFNKNDIAITDLTTKVGKSDFRVSGLLKNLFGAMLLENGRMLADVEIKSDKLDIEELLSFRNGAEESIIEKTTKPKGIFPFMEKYAIKVDIDVKEILYKKILMHQFRGALSFDQPYTKTDNISFSIAGGEIVLNSQLNFESENKIITTLRSTLKTINIDSLFYMFDDFGQNFITHKNLKGEFSGAVETAFNWNSKGEINTKSLVASVDGSILKGELNDFEPMQNLARFIDAKELAHIQFSEIKNKVFIENEKIALPEMQILSNVSDISISGTHTFGNEMDYKLTVPLKNIKKPKIDKDAAFGAIEEDSKKGSTLFLTIKGNANDYKIGYDTKRTKKKISEDLKKEKVEFLNIFKKKEKEIQPTVKPKEDVFFDF
ncbi:MAG TPA: AsmA-like C-terminal region-containing protein, partial [Cytophagaceae bacterium]|nr:AsmA-like C-terminal region-containing protein [Cytophagaceae bacterium]